MKSPSMRRYLLLIMFNKNIPKYITNNIENPGFLPYGRKIKQIPIHTNQHHI